MPKIDFTYMEGIEVITRMELSAIFLEQIQVIHTAKQCNANGVNDASAPFGTSQTKCTHGTNVLL